MRMRYHRTTSAGACGRYVSKEPTAATNNGLRPWRPARRTMCGASRNGSAIPPSRVSYRQTPPEFGAGWKTNADQLDAELRRWRPARRDPKKREWGHARADQVRGDEESRERVRAGHHVR